MTTELGKILILPNEKVDEHYEAIRQKAFEANAPVISLSPDGTKLIREFADGRTEEKNLER